MINEIKITNKLSVEDFLYLRKLVNFQLLDERQARAMIEHSTEVFVAEYNGEVIGFTRLLFDYVTDAYITDVIVHPEHQGCGVGRLLINHTVEFVRDNVIGPSRVTCNLYANKGKEDFYTKLGFEKLPTEEFGYGMILEMGHKRER